MHDLPKKGHDRCTKKIKPITPLWNLRYKTTSIIRPCRLCYKQKVLYHTKKDHPHYMIPFSQILEGLIPEVPLNKGVVACVTVWAFNLGIKSIVSWYRLLGTKQRHLSNFTLLELRKRSSIRLKLTEKYKDKTKMSS